MKRKMTRVKPDGTKEIIEIDDQAPAMQQAKTKSQSEAQKGRMGDDRMAHVNRWEEELLKRLGGSGTTNPQTGRKEFFNAAEYMKLDPTYQNDMTGTWAENVKAKNAALPYWQQSTFNPNGGVSSAPMFDSGQYAYDPSVKYTPPAVNGVVQQSPYTNKNWQQILGNTGGSLGANVTVDPVETLTNNNNVSTSTGGDFFDIPLDIAPYSTSASTATGTNQSTANSQSRSGLPQNYQEALLSALMPQLN